MLLMNMELKTERLVLRELAESDAKDIKENANSKGISKYLVLMPYPYSLKDAKEFINHALEASMERPRKEYNFGITLHGEGKVIGIISIDSISMVHETGNIGYWLGENHHRKGYMTEAFRKVLDFSFNELELRRINMRAFVENVASNKLISNMGFVYEDTQIEALKDKATGKLHDEHIYRLLRKEYLAKKHG